MTTRHKHADVIIAWANGAEIESKVAATGEWRKIDTPRWYEEYEYRVKPPTRKYRVGLFRKYKDNEPLVVAVNSQVTADNFESMPDFVRWLTDWVEYEE